MNSKGNPMHKFIAAASVAALLAGCMPHGVTITAPSQRTIYEAEVTYDAAFLVPLSNYSKLPRCAAGAAISFSNLCSNAATVGRLRADDRNVALALLAVRAYSKAHPGALGISDLFSAFTTAISLAEQDAVASGIPSAKVQ